MLDRYTFLPVFPPRCVPSVPYPELRSEPVRYLIVTIVDCSRVLVSLALLLSSLAHVLALTVIAIRLLFWQGCSTAREDVRHNNAVDGGKTARSPIGK